MRSKLLSLIGLSILTIIIFLSVVSATLTFSNVPTLSQTGTSFDITISSDKNETVAFSGLEKITEGSEEITFTVPSNITINDTVSQVVTVNYAVDSGFDFEFGEIYSTTLQADGNFSDLISQTVSFVVNTDACESVQNLGNNLRVRIKDISVESKFGDDEEWFPLDEIQVEIEVENNGDERINNIEVNWGLYNTNTGEWYIEEEENDFDLKDGKDEIVTITFKLDDDVDEFEDDDDYEFYAWAIGEDEEFDDDETCSSDLESINMMIERDFVILYNINIPETVSCGSDVQITADVWNIGSRNQDDVYVGIFNKALGINDEVIIGDIDSFEDETFTFDFQVPKDADEKTYAIKLKVYDEDNDIFENDDDVESNFDAITKVEGGCTGGAEALVSASLVSGGKAGQELVIKATITNTGDSLATYLLNAAGYTPWASSAEFDQSTVLLSAGSSQDVLITFNVNKDALGDQVFDLEVVSENELLVKQPVSVTITKAGFSITGAAIGDNWYLWGIGALNIILVIIIIIVAVKVARK